MTDLNADQARRVERVLRRRGTTCPQCGSTDLSSNGVWMRNISGAVVVGVLCNNRTVEDHPQGFEISPSPQLTDDEAREVGLPVRSGSPPPRRPPGGTFPM